MVTNTYLTIDMITEEALVVLKNNFVLGRMCLRSFDSSFGKVQAQIGDTIRIRVPSRFTTVTGPAAAPQNTTQIQIPLAVQTQRHADFEYTTADLTLQLGEFSDQVLKSAMAQLASDIDSDGLATIIGGTIASGTYAGSYSGIANLVTPGAITNGAPAAWVGNDLSTLLPFNNARAYLEGESAPKGDRYTMIDPFSSAGVVDFLKSLFQDSTQISEQYKNGYMGTAAGFEWNESNNLPAFTAGTRLATGNVVTTTSVDGDTTLAVTLTGVGLTVNKGDQLWVALVNAINPLNRKSYGKKRLFVATATVTSDGSSHVVIPVSTGQAAGAPIVSSGAANPQYATVDTLPQSGAAVTFVGAASASTVAQLAWHKDAFALGVVPLKDVSGKGAECYFATDEESGLGLRHVSQYLSSTDQVIDRIDILYGWQLVRPSLACRVQG